MLFESKLDLCNVVLLFYFSRSDLAALLIDSLFCFGVYQLALHPLSKALNTSQWKSTCTYAHDLPGVYRLP